MADPKERFTEEAFQLLFERHPQPMWVQDLETLEFLAVNEAAIVHYGYSREELLAMTIADIGTLEDVPELIRVFASLRKGDGTPLGSGGTWRHRRKDGTLVDVETTHRLISLQGRDAALVLVSDVTERRRMEAALGRLQAIQSATDAALARLSLGDLMRELLARLRVLLQTDTAMVLLVDEDTQLFTVRASDGLDVEKAAEINIEQVRSLLGVPLLVEGQMIGVLHVGSREKRRFNDEDLELLRIVADRVAPAIDRARLFEEVREGRERFLELSRGLVELQEAERRKIARELHDEIGQLLTGLKLLIEGGGRNRSGGEEETSMREEAPSGDQDSDREEMKALVDDLLGRVRNLSMDLRPAMLDQLGIVPALLWLFERHRAQTGIHVDFHHHGADRRFPADIETWAYRIVQEALTNVARYAGVGHAKVELRADDERLQICIEDKGRGFDVGKTSSTASSGITGMRERTRLVGGRLKVESAPGAGTCLTAEMPLAMTAGTARGTRKPDRRRGGDEQQSAP